MVDSFPILGKAVQQTVSSSPPTTSQRSATSSTISPPLTTEGTHLPTQTSASTSSTSPISPTSPITPTSSGTSGKLTMAEWIGIAVGILSLMAALTGVGFAYWQMKHAKWKQANVEGSVPFMNQRYNSRGRNLY